MSSVYYEILKAVKDGLTTELTPYNVPVVLRRRSVWTQTDTLPIVIVSPQDEELLKEQDMMDGSTWQYPISINMIWPDNRQNDLEAEAQEYLDIRQTIRYWVYYPLLPTVPTVWNSDFGSNYTSSGEYGTKPFELVDQKSTYSSTIWIIKYKSREDRRPIT